MTQWLPDPTNRFTRRPLFERNDIEAWCQALLTNFLAESNRTWDSSPSTTDLELLADSLTSEYQPVSDLSDIGKDVEGATFFMSDTKPKIKISADLDEPLYKRRRRMTIAHEIGHVLLHGNLFTSEETLDLFSNLSERGNVYCKRTTMSPGNDWMEWQASYAAGAILTPRDRLQRFLNASSNTTFVKVFREGTPETQQLVEDVSENFDVSRDAAFIRLIQCTFIVPNPTQPLPL
jgi:Zn-dependent peptidase ImmA (M78 family)